MDFLQLRMRPRVFFRRVEYDGKTDRVKRMSWRGASIIILKSFLVL